jgi:transposase
MSAARAASVSCFSPQRVSAAERLSERGAARSPCARSAAVPLATGPCPVCPLLEEHCRATREAAYWRAMHRRAVERESQLKHRLAELEAKLRLREQQLFRRKTEAWSSPRPPPTGAPTMPAAARRPRGQQAARPGHGRRDYRHLPATVEEATLSGDAACYPRCPQPFQGLSGTEDSTVLEIAVRAHGRIVRRQRYRPTCRCGLVPQVVTAPPPPRLIPKSLLGVSIWVTVLLDKYLFYRPTYRLLADLDSHGLGLSLGTLTDGLQRLVPLFEPLYEAFVQRSRQQPLWHADGTRWLVFVTIEGKVGYRWYLQVFHAREVVVLVLLELRKFSSNCYLQLWPGRVM